jgi:hypothetical protein
VFHIPKRLLVVSGNMRGMLAPLKLLFSNVARKVTLIMDFDDPDSLSPEQKLREQEITSRFFNLVRDERSRYEIQAGTLMANNIFVLENLRYDLTYSIQLGRYICSALSRSPLSQSFSIEVPIPKTQKEKIETLIELFAQSEAGLIH